MDATIIAIGTELTIGRTVNTNAAWLSAELLRVGLRTRAHITLPDDHTQMVAAIADACATTPVTIVTGGLGPTADDLTREAVAEALDVRYEVDERLLGRFAAIWRSRFGTELPAHSAKQFWRPVSGESLPNTAGVALGFIVGHDRLPAGVDGVGGPGRGILVVLPGVPVEMRTIVSDELLVRLCDRLPDLPRVQMRELMVAGMPEAGIDQAVRDLIEPGRDPAGSITLAEALGGIALRFSTSDTDEAVARQRLDTVEAEVRRRLGDKVYSATGESLAQALAGELMRRNLTVGLAESCTAGLATALLGQVPGVSQVLLESVVTYSNAAKQRRLDVSTELIETHGAVSEPVACAMAEGICRKAGVDVGIAITGIAGPDGGTDDKPVGLVWSAVCYRNGTTVSSHRIRGDRETIQLRAAFRSLNHARERLIRP